LNYVPHAVVDDGRCAIGGCTDSTLSTFSPLANYDDGSCPPKLVGCTDKTAYNFRKVATVDDGSCKYLGCTDSTARDFDDAATLPGRCEYAVEGCTQKQAINFFPNANTDDGSCLIAGCTDPTRNNYDPSATVNDGTCEPLYPGCTDSVAYNYRPLFNAAGGTACSIGGCTDPTKAEYDARATFFDGTCALGRRRALESTRRRLSSGCMDPSSGGSPSASVALRLRTRIAQTATPAPPHRNLRCECHHARPHRVLDRRRGVHLLGRLQLHVDRHCGG
jgi:hypothetical protein